LGFWIDIALFQGQVPGEPKRIKRGISYDPIRRSAVALAKADESRAGKKFGFVVGEGFIPSRYSGGREACP